MIVRLLVANKAELSEQNRAGATPLILAAATGQEAVVELLLHSGAGLHLVDATDRSALEVALEGGHLGALRILLQQSMVDINGITKRGSSLLHLAAEVGEEERVTFLLQMQAQVGSACSKLPYLYGAPNWDTAPLAHLAGRRAQPKRRDAAALGLLAGAPRRGALPRGVRRRRHGA